MSDLLSRLREAAYLLENDPDVDVEELGLVGLLDEAATFIGTNVPALSESVASLIGTVGSLIGQDATDESRSASSFAAAEEGGSGGRYFPLHMGSVQRDERLHSRLRLIEALAPFAELGIDLTDRVCHRGICPPEDCGRCGRVLAARAALAGSLNQALVEEPQRWLRSDARLQADGSTRCTCEDPDGSPALIANDCPFHNWRYGENVADPRPGTPEGREPDGWVVREDARSVADAKAGNGTQRRHIAVNQIASGGDSPIYIGTPGPDREAGEEQVAVRLGQILRDIAVEFQIPLCLLVQPMKEDDDGG